MDPGIAVIIGLIVAGLALVLAEIFIPGGIAGSVGALCLVVAVIMTFTKNATAGMITLAGVIVFGAVAAWAWVKYLPQTPIGRKMMPNKDAGEWHGWETRNSELLGKTGVAQSMLRPGGVAMIDGERVDVVTQGEMIDRGEKIRVVEVEGNRVVVEQDLTGEDEAPESAA